MTVSLGQGEIIGKFMTGIVRILEDVFCCFKFCAIHDSETVGLYILLGRYGAVSIDFWEIGG